MKAKYDVAIVGSGFAGSLLARILTRLGYEVALLERGTHPRFAIGESSTPLANLSLERIGLRYGLEDCYSLATHGRWLAKYPQLRRGLKRGFTFYRHHPGQRFADHGRSSERLLVAASPDDAIADTHWLRSDVDHHFVRRAEAAGVHYLNNVDLSAAHVARTGVCLAGKRRGEPLEIHAAFVVDASGPAGFLARQLGIASGLDRTHTRVALVYSHFDDARLMSDLVPDLREGPYPDDWAAVHHIIDEGWMYSLRFDHGTTSAGFLLRPDAAILAEHRDAASLWRALLDRYPTISDAFADARPTMPIAFRPLIQHRLTRAVGDRWLLMPHAYAFVDPLFSTGIAWSLRAVERIALMFEDVTRNGRVPHASALEHYASLLTAEADQIDLLVAGAYKAMAHFDLFAAQAMLYFAAVSYAEATQRLKPTDDVAWKGFLGIGDPVLEPLPREALERLIVATSFSPGKATDARKEFVDWIPNAIGPRNVAGLADCARNNLYGVDFNALVDAHALLGLTRDELIAALPALRGSKTSDHDLKSNFFRLTTPAPDSIVGGP
ncbi:MAG TPA: FAD-dependent oxidoreductase [Gemmatimonadaceae bacterium]|nr:FAD-dependent oxidoreductase [Gemmatimonadaceae bacterium]